MITNAWLPDMLKSMTKRLTIEFSNIYFHKQLGVYVSFNDKEPEIGIIYSQNVTYVMKANSRLQDSDTAYSSGFQLLHATNPQIRF